MHRGRHGARLRRRVGFGACGLALLALAGILEHWWRDAALAGVLVSAVGAFVSVVALTADILRGDTAGSPRPAAEVRRLAAGVLVGLVGGCVCGVYRALSVPSDIMRAADPGSSLHTDRTASFTRGGLVALLVAVVSVPVVALPGDRGGLAHVGTQLWLPLGTAALALSAWGRFTVARVWLAVTGRMPWRLMAFLEDAHRRGVLRRSGACFEFRHLRLQAHLAQGRAGAAGSRSAGTERDPAAAGTVHRSGQ